MLVLIAFMSDVQFIVISKTANTNTLPTVTAVHVHVFYTFTICIYMYMCMYKRVYAYHMAYFNAMASYS